MSRPSVIKNCTVYMAAYSLWRAPATEVDAYYPAATQCQTITMLWPTLISFRLILIGMGGSRDGAPTRKDGAVSRAMRMLKRDSKQVLHSDIRWCGHRVRPRFAADTDAARETMPTPSFANCVRLCMFLEQFLLFDPVKMEIVFEGRDSRSWITTCSFSPDGATFALASMDNKIYLYDSKSFALRAKARGTGVVEVRSDFLRQWMERSGMVMVVRRDEAMQCGRHCRRPR